MRVRVHLWIGAGRAVPPGGTAVIVDVLRATTTLTAALARGAGRVVPAATPEEAFALHERLPGSLLCGERDGRRIDGFDLGNSPFEYHAALVKDRTLIFASTNGSLALRAAAEARSRVLAAFANAGAVVDRLHGEREVSIQCAGKLGRFALEDAACAGLLCERLEGRGARLDGRAAALARRLAPGTAAEVRSLVQGCSHGRYLRALGAEFARDVEFCGRLDALDQAFDV